ncbi:Uncharacterized protein QTN25_010625 [Entamoeba marina]
MEHQTQLQAQVDLYQALDQLTYTYYEEFKNIRKNDKVNEEKWREEERIARAQTMFTLEDGRYYIKNGTVMYYLSSKDIITKSSVNEMVI